MLFVHGCDAANRETISLMNVGHRKSAADDAGKHGHIRGLLERLVLPDRLQQRLVGVNHGVGRIPGLYVLGISQR